MIMISKKKLIQSSRFERGGMRLIVPLYNENGKNVTFQIFLQRIVRMDNVQIQYI